MIYLDHAAATPVRTEVMAAMKPYFSQQFYNPSATYLPAKKVAADLQKSREAIAKWLGSRPAEIIFTSGGTEANNLAISGVMQQFPEGNAVISAVEHESVRKPVAQYSHRIAPVLPSGLIDLEKLEKAISNKTVLVSVIYANNEIGTIQPIRQIAQMIETILKSRAKAGNKLPIYLHTDACQAGDYLDLHVSRLGVDLMTLNGGKIYGPKQSGVLFVKANTQLHPQILGGGQEFGRRSGTENVAGSIVFAKALDIAQTGRQAESKRLQALQKAFIDLLKKKIPSAVINGTLNQRLPNNVHVTLPGYDNERLMLQLEEKGILCAAGSACSASSDEPSHVLKAIGLSDKDAQSSLRFSMGNPTTLKDVEKTVQALYSCL